LLSNDKFYFKYLQQQAKEAKEAIEIISCLNMHPIKHTKLYWLLSRCLGEEPERRSIIHL
jgi:hypothetical protein